MEYKLIRALGDNTEIPLFIIDSYFKDKTISSSEYELSDLGKKSYCPTNEITHFSIREESDNLVVSTFFRKEEREIYDFPLTPDLKTSTFNGCFVIVGFEKNMNSVVRLCFL